MNNINIALAYINGTENPLKVFCNLFIYVLNKADNQKLRIDEVKEARNEQVEDALFKCAKGYHYYEEVATKVKEEVEGENGTVLVKEDVKISLVKKYKGPDREAQKYWLNNRKKPQWKDDPNKVENDKKALKLKEKELSGKGF